MAHALTLSAARLSAARLSAARLWRAYPREMLVVGGLGLAATVAFAGAAYSTPGVSGLGMGAIETADAPPAPPPLLVRPLAPQDALSINRSIPLAAMPNPAARPFSLRGADRATQARALECLTSAVYYEAGSEGLDGQKAVAQVVLNRVRHPAFPSSVCDVVYQGSTRPTGCQFTFTCDGSLLRQPSADGWARARKIAWAALTGTVYAPAGYATHYHANYVVPYWADSLAKNAVVGAHIFYRWAGGWGRPAAFGKRYAAREPNTQSLISAAIAAEAAHAAAPAESVVDVVAAIPGAEMIKPGEGRVGVRFTLAARKAVEDAPHTEYVDKFEASDNLRWTLGEAAESTEKPLGAPAPAVAAGGGAAIGSPQR